MLVASSFWDAFFILLIWIPAVMLWTFALLDIFRRDDIGGWSKALWVAVVVFLPYFGTLIYLIARPPAATREEQAAIDQASRDFVARYSPDDNAAQLKVLSELHDRGKLTDDEFAAEKQRVLGGAAPSPA